MVRRALPPVLLLLSLAMTGCTNHQTIANQPIDAIDNTSLFRSGQARGGKFGNHLVFLAFSGGGVRASALAYGVLKSLRDTQIPGEQTESMRLLDEVDVISSVSGGSFTSAYYGLYGDEIFDKYEGDFLKNGFQSRLIHELVSPVHWWKSLTSGFDRTEMAVDFYDRTLFHGKTFGDIRIKDGPFIEINATDLGGGNRFSFIQSYFDAICSNLHDFPISRAVAASSAAPVAFTSVVLKNHVGQCNPHRSYILEFILDNEFQDPKSVEIRHRLQSYMDLAHHPYIHLIDGYVADNLGTRAISERINILNRGLVWAQHAQHIEDVLVISVDADVSDEHSLNETPEKPSIVDTYEKISDTQIRMRNNDSRSELARSLSDLEHYVQEKKGRDINIYNVTVSLEEVEMASLKRYLNDIPTTLELSPDQVDILIKVGGDLLRADPAFRDFLKHNPVKSQEAPPKAGS
jgi:NTE family protein